VEATGTLGQRFGSQKRFGALIGGSYDWNGRGIDDLEPVPDQAVNMPGSPTQYEAIDIREYRYYRTRWGMAGSLDYKPSMDRRCTYMGCIRTLRILASGGCTR